MELFSSGVYLFLCAGEIVVEEVDNNEYTGHIAYIEVREDSHCKADYKHTVFAVFYNAFNAEHDNGKKDKVVYPHGVMLHYNGITAKSVHCGKYNGGYTVSLS